MKTIDKYREEFKSLYLEAQEYGLNQQELARRAGISSKTIMNFLHGISKNITVNNLNKMVTETEKFIEIFKAKRDEN